MKVLAITNIYPSADSPANGVFVAEQVRGLQARGLQVRVLFLDRRREGPLIYYRFQPDLRQALSEFRPDLVHVMYGGLMARQVTETSRLPPVVVTFHGSDLLGENLSGLWRRWISAYGVHCSRKAAGRAHGIVLVARHLLNSLGTGIQRSKIRVIPCGIDLERFKPMDQALCRQQLGWESGRFHVVFATSAGDPVKRPWLSRAAVDLLNQKHSAQLHIMTGVPNHEVPRWLNGSDVLLLTSKHEGSPTVVKEALATGLPIVSVNVGDVAERLEGIDGCYLAEPDPADLARKLDRVRQRRARLDCREQLSGLSCAAIAKRLEQFYEELIGRPAIAPQVF